MEFACTTQQAKIDNNNSLRQPQTTPHRRQQIRREVIHRRLKSVGFGDISTTTKQSDEQKVAGKTTLKDDLLLLAAKQEQPQQQPWSGMRQLISKPPSAAIKTTTTTTKEEKPEVRQKTCQWKKVSPGDLSSFLSITKITTAAEKIDTSKQIPPMDAQSKSAEQQSAPTLLSGQEGGNDDATDDDETSTDEYEEQQSALSVIVGRAPSHLKCYSALVQTPLKPPEPCAVCCAEPPVNARALPFGPYVLRKRKVPLPPHFVLVGRGGNGLNGKFKNNRGNNDGKQHQQRMISCCRKCFDFFRSIVMRHRGGVLQPPNLFRCLEGTGNCAIYSENNDYTEKKERCAACWLDRCLLAGLTAKAVSTEDSFNWVSKKARLRVEQLDASFSWRLERLKERQNSSYQMNPKANIVVDENLLEFGLLKSMAYIDEQFSNLRLACSSPRRINRVFKMFEHLSLTDLAGSIPILMGSSQTQKKLLFADDLMAEENASNHIDCVIPNNRLYNNADYIPIFLAHNDLFFVNIYFSYLDVFLCFELAHTMPVFRVLDKKDTLIQLGYASFFCRALAQVSFSAALGAPEIIQPNGDLTHRTMLAVVRKAQKAIAVQQKYTASSSYLASGYIEKATEIQHHEEQQYCSAKIEEESVEMVPILVRVAPQLLTEYEEASRRMRIDLLQPFLRAKLNTMEVLLLRAILITSPSPSGLSEDARLLLEIERNKHIKLLKTHLRNEHTTEQAMEQRFTELMALLEVVAELRQLACRLGELAFLLFKIPVHRHPGEAEEDRRRAHPAFMTECYGPNSPIRAIKSTKNA